MIAILLSMIIFVAEIMIIYTRILEYKSEHDVKNPKLINLDNVLSVMIMACIPVINACFGLYLILLVYDEDFMRENF